MTDDPDKKAFAQDLLDQDMPPTDKQQQHKEALFKIIEQRVWREKIIGTIVYFALFLASFLALWRSRSTDNVIHSICWGAVSLHTLLWFLIYFLRGIYRILAETFEESSEGNAQTKWKKDDQFVAMVAVLIFLSSTYMLYRSFLSTDPLRASSMAGGVFWATVFFLFYYPFATASLAAKLWLEYKKMQIQLDDNKKK